MDKQTWKEIARWIITILSAILAGLGAESCIQNPETLACLFNF